MRTSPLSSAIFLALCVVSTLAYSFANEAGHEKYNLPEYTVHNVSRRAPVEEHIRVRRALYSSAGAQMTCDPAWTGLYCENPICYDQVKSPAPPTGLQPIDLVYLPSGCSNEVNFPVEEGVRELRITVATNIGKPALTLTNHLGAIVPDDASTSVPTQGVFIFEKPISGAYRIDIDMGGLETEFCHVEIDVVESELGVAVRSGFIWEPHTDYTEETLTSGHPMYLAVHAFNLSSPGAPAAVRVRKHKETRYSYTQLLTRRYECGFEYYAGLVDCEADNEYIATVDGTDHYGYKFRRSKKFACLKPKPTTPAPATTPAPLQKCFNGGSILNAGTTNSVCFCPELFTGRQCEQAACMNGGTPQGQLECQCPPEFSGPNCQYVNCPKKSFNFDTNDRTLVVVVRKTQSMAPYIQKIAETLQYVNDKMIGEDGQSVYRGFALITFANDQVESNRFANIGQLINTLTNTTLVAATGSNCSDSISKAIAEAFEVPFVFNKSPIHVFTDVVADDKDDYYEVVTKNTIKKFPIYFFVPQGGACNADPMSPGARTMDMIARHSGGLVYTPTPSNFVNIAESVIRSSSNHAATLLINDYRRCKTTSYNTFIVDPSIQYVMILATGKNLSISLSDPTGATIVPTPYIADGNNYVWEVEGRLFGEYLMTLKSAQDTAPCGFRVIGMSTHELFFGISTGLANDYAMTDPIYQLPNHMVAHFNGIDESKVDQFRLFAEISITTTDAEGYSVPIYYSSGVYRSGCDYKLYFGPFTCTTAEQLLYITVYADDPSGATVQRTAVGICAHKPLQPVPPSGCQNGGVINPFKNDTCICTPNYSGPHCENIVCQNGGNAVYGRCDCPQGVTGRFCELLQCTQTTEGVSFDSEHRSLTFILSTRSSMQSTLNDIANKVGDLVRDLQSASTSFITQYTLITVNQTDVTEIRTTADPKGFADSVKYVAANLAQQATPETSCTVRLEQGISMAVNKSLPSSYIFVFADSDDVSDGGLDYIYALTAAIEQQTSVYLTTSQSTVCTNNGTGPFGDRFTEFIEYTAGDILYTTNAGKILDFIPALHNSGLAGAYEGDEDDCADPKGIDFFVPVDGWTQSLFLFAHGDNVQMTVTLPSGAPADPTDYKNTIVAGSQTAITEFIIPCDDEWTEMKGRYCFQYDPFTNNTYADASARCHRFGGSLVDIFSQDKETQIENGVSGMESWIGLQRINGIWEWDVPSGVSQVELSENSYTNWDANEPSAPGSGKDCVVIKKDSNNALKWFTEDCTKSVYSVCQKHRYGQTMMPSDPTKNRLPAGVWTVNMKTASGGCRLLSRVQSYIQVYYGITTDGVHSDKALRYGNIKSKSNRYIATATGLTAGNSDFNPNGVDGRLNYGFMYKSGAMFSPVTFQLRASCAYKSVSQDFACPDYFTGNKYMEKYPVKFSGIDQFGNLFERWSTAVCVIRQSTCQNGGVENDGKCVCQPGFTGPNCEYNICLNNGEQSANGCTCPPEFTGPSCEFPICDQKSASNFYNDGRTLAIVLETTFKTTPAIITLQRKLKKIIDDLQSGPTAKWFNNYILYPFDSFSDKERWYKPVVATTSDDLVKAIKTIPLYECPDNQLCETGNNCPRPILTALNETLNHPQFTSPNSVVFVITRSSAEDAALYYTIEPVIQKSRAQINFILPDVASPCNTGFETIGANALFRVAQVSGGNVFLMTSGEMVNTFLPNYLPSLYKSATLNSGYADRGCESLEFFFQIDSGTTEFTVDFYGQQPSVVLYTPNGQQIPSKPSLITSGGNYLGVYKIGESADMTPGIYRIQMKSAGDRCALNVRGRSDIEIYAGFTQVNDAVNGATQDDAHFAPVQGAGKKNVALFHADGFGEPGAMLYYAQIISFRRGLEFTTPLVKRQGCTYQYVSTMSFDCPQPTFFMMVHGIDAKGHHFERLFLTHCLDTRAPALPGPPSCVLAETKNDFVFVVDSSSELNQAAFQDIKKLIVNTMASYQVASGNSQVAALTVSNDVHPSFNYADTASGNLADLVNNKIVYDGSAGQALNNGLNYIKNTISVNNRQGVRHVVVYITSNANFTAGDPVETAKVLKRAGVSGFITIGYNIPVWDTSLELVAGPRCTFTTSSSSDLAKYGQNFIQSNSCRERPICGEA
uniref:EGF-like domain-containing protein n=1 Tax=Steinernema glaseri TaxID=37863 RepID=A0A1I7ZJD0_9BILA